MTVTIAIWRTTLASSKYASPFRRYQDEPQHTDGMTRPASDWWANRACSSSAAHPARLDRVGDDESRRTSASVSLTDGLIGMGVTRSNADGRRETGNQSMALPPDHPAWRDGPYSGQVSPTSTRFSSNPPSPETRRTSPEAFRSPQGSQSSMTRSGTLPPRGPSYTNLVQRAREGHPRQAHASGSGPQHAATRRTSSSGGSDPFGGYICSNSQDHLLRNSADRDSFR